MAIVICVNAQTPTATLQQGDVITPYYGENAFKDAYNSAEDGAVITLSAGNFQSPVDIKKSITIIGSGAFGEEEQITYIGSLYIYTNNLRVEGVYISTLSPRDGAVNSTIRHCYIDVCEFYGDKAVNTIIDQCVINSTRYHGIGTCIKNCTIKECKSEGNATNPVTFINDVIFYGWYANYARYNVFRNCVIGFGQIGSDVTLESPGQYYNNIFFKYSDNGSDELLTVNYGNGCVNSGNVVATYNSLFNGTLNMPAYPNTEVKGDDNTKVGPEGGSGFKLYPAIPRIISKSIDRQTDAEGKINVNIQVKAEE